MFQYLCVVKVDDKPYENHFFMIPMVIMTGGYRATISYNATRSREITRWHEKYYLKRKVCPRWLDMNPVNDVTMVHDVPTYFHKSIWDMYIAVGYSYKKRRFII